MKISTKCIGAQRKGRMGCGFYPPPPLHRALPHARTHTQTAIILGSPLLEQHTGSDQSVRSVAARQETYRDGKGAKTRRASHADPSTRDLPPVRLSQQSAHISSSGGYSRPQLSAFSGRCQARCAMGQACRHALLCRSHTPSSEM